MTTRISRDVVNMPGPGRTKQFVEEFAQLRLHGIEPGSTVLRFSKGPTDKLDVDLPEQTVIDDRFWELLHAAGEDRRPDGVSDRIAESVAKLVSACQAAAPTVIIAAASRGKVQIRPAAAHVETWLPKRIDSGAAMSAAGRLAKVDLRTHEFRLRDDVDNTVDLKHVENDAVAAQLIGQWVIARGIRGVPQRGTFVSQVAATVVDTDAFSLIYLRERAENLTPTQ